MGEPQVNDSPTHMLDPLAHALIVGDNKRMTYQIDERFTRKVCHAAFAYHPFMLVAFIHFTKHFELARISLLLNTS
jgi:hypothetical protein